MRNSKPLKNLKSSQKIIICIKIKAPNIKTMEDKVTFAFSKAESLSLTINILSCRKKVKREYLTISKIKAWANTIRMIRFIFNSLSRRWT